MSYWKMSGFTKSELARVDQDEHAEAMYTLRHSPAACEMFAKAQFYGTLGKGFHAEQMNFNHCLELLSNELLNRHWWRTGYHNPFRMLPASAYDFLRLQNALGYESKPVKYSNDTVIRTILGWWQV